MGCVQSLDTALKGGDLRFKAGEWVEATEEEGHEVCWFRIEDNKNGKLYGRNINEKSEAKESLVCSKEIKEPLASKVFPKFEIEFNYMGKGVWYAGTLVHITQNCDFLAGTSGYEFTFFDSKREIREKVYDPELLRPRSSECKPPDEGPDTTKEDDESWAKFQKQIQKARAETVPTKCHKCGWENKSKTAQHGQPCPSCGTVF